MADNSEDNRDYLTGLYNRKQALEGITAAIESARNATEPLSVIVLDIDNMKRLNDYYGLPCGDYIIQEIAQILDKNVPSDALLARTQGNEFTIVLANTKEESARIL